MNYINDEVLLMNYINMVSYTFLERYFDVRKCASEQQQKKQT